MSGINFIGSYSGIDQSTIDKLMQAERLPLNQLTSKKTDITAKQNAWKDVNTRLTSLFNRLKDLQDPSTFNSMTAKVGSDRNIVSATASKDAIAGKYDIDVTQLATSSRIISGKIDVDNIKAGELTIENEDGAVAKITVESGDSLQDIANKINEASKNGLKSETDSTKTNVGISASVINGQLVITDDKTGARSITFKGEADTIASLGLDKEVDKGQEAIFTINGVEGTSATNTLKDNVLGLSINLYKEGTETITVGADTEKLTKAIQDFVNQYNSTMTFIEEKMSPGTVSSGTDGSYTTTGRGPLAGDSSLQNLYSGLRKMVSDVLNVEGSDIRSISQLGVTTTDDKTSRLAFDSSKLLDEFAKDPENVINFFNQKVGDTDTGFVSRLNDRIDGYISSKDGLIKSKNESFDRSLKDINKRIESFNERMVRKEEYYKRQFAALDSAMMQAESQMEWLQGQISAMNAQAKSK